VSPPDAYGEELRLDHIWVVGSVGVVFPLRNFHRVLSVETSSFAPCQVKLTPVVHVGGAGETVDMYETPLRIRNQVILRDPYDVAPWSSTLSRNCDVDHTIPFEPGVVGQTRADNLGPLSRRYHRAKTLAGWQLEQPDLGVFLWETPTGQRFQVDKTGTHRLPSRE